MIFGASRNDKGLKNTEKTLSGERFGYQRGDRVRRSVQSQSSRLGETVPIRRVGSAEKKTRLQDLNPSGMRIAPFKQNLMQHVSSVL